MRLACCTIHYRGLDINQLPAIFPKLVDFVCEFLISKFIIIRTWKSEMYPFITSTYCTFAEHDGSSQQHTYCEWFPV